MLRTSVYGLAAATVVALAAPQARAQNDDPFTTPEEIRAEVSDAMDAIAAYSVQERDQALATAQAALTRLDAVIERREQALRENWADMSDAARETARESMRDLRAARTGLAERYGALQAGAGSAWDELRDGFTGAWDAFAEAWRPAAPGAEAD